MLTTGRKNRIAATLTSLTVALAGAAVIGTPTAAYAADCKSYYGSQNDGGYVFALCYNSGNLNFRVGGTCEENSGHEYNLYGNWASNGGVSYAWCHQGAWPVNHWVSF